MNMLLESREWKDTPGGYSCIGVAAAYINWLNGSYTNMLGLPLAETYNMLQGLGIKQKMNY